MEGCGWIEASHYDEPRVLWKMTEVAKGVMDMLSWNLNESQMALTSLRDNMQYGKHVLGPPKDIEHKGMRVRLFQKSQDAKTLNAEGEDKFMLGCNHWGDSEMIP